MQGTMRRVIAFLLAAVLTIGVLPGLTTQAKAAGEVCKEFYVATTGSDEADGSVNTPFKTIERARQAVDEINENMTGDIIVNIAPGDYYLDEAITFGESDSGVNGYEVIYRCSGNVGEARIHGGKKVEGTWTLAGEEDVALGLRAGLTDKVYKIDLDESKFQFNTLYVNGQRAINARTCNFEYDPQFQASRGPWLYAAGGGMYHVNYRAGDLDEASLNGMRLAQQRGEAEIARVTTWCGAGWGSIFNWFTDTVPLASIDETNRQLNFCRVENRPEMYRSKYGVVGGSRYIVEGNIGFLDVEGEYFYHKPTGTLYYYPRTNESVESLNVVAPTTIEALKLEGTKKAAAKDEPVAAEQVHNITFEGLAVMDTDFPNYYSSSWNSYDDPGNSPQIGYFPAEALRDGITNPSYCEVTERPELRTGAIVLRDANHITVDSCRITNIGLHGLFMDGDNQYHTVKNCEFSNIGHSGIITDGGYPGVGKWNDHHTLNNLLVHDVGNLVGNAYGIAIMASNNNDVSHAEIYNSPRRGFYIMGTWANRHTAHNANCPEGCILDLCVQYRDSNTYENDIEYLYLHDCEQEGSDDGAFFTSTLYGSFGDTSGSKPNRLNQVVIGDIAAYPGISADWNPSNMNLDMGAKGLELTNVKSINPQQLNIRGGHDVAKMENVNYFHYTNADGFAGNGGCNMWRTFDESKMDYANIGVVAGFSFGLTTAEKYLDIPDSAYEDLYFRDDFDNGLTEWWDMSGKCETSPVFFSDGNKMHGNSFRADSNWNADSEGSRNGTNIQRPFGVELDKIVEIDFYDRFLHGTDGGIWSGAGQDIHMNAFARVDDGETNCGIGVNSTKDYNHYMYEIGDAQYSTKVPRKAGWHTLKWDYSQANVASLYIDGTLIAEVPDAETFNTIRMGDYGKRGAAYFDNVVVYGGEKAEGPGTLPEKPGEPEKASRPVSGQKFEAESCDQQNGMQIYKGSGPSNGKALSNVDKGDWAVFENLDFGETAYAYDLFLNMAIDPSYTGGTFTFYLDSLDGTQIGMIQFNTPTCGFTTFQEQQLKLSEVSGVHDLYVVAGDRDTGVGTFDYMRFSEAPGVQTLRAQPNFNGILVCWEPVEGASVNVYRKGPSDTDFTKVKMVEDGSGFLDTNVNEGKTYQYKITVEKDSTEGTASNIVSVTAVEAAKVFEDTFDSWNGTKWTDTNGNQPTTPSVKNGRWSIGRGDMKYLANYTDADTSPEFALEAEFILQTPVGTEDYDAVGLFTQYGNGNDGMSYFLLRSASQQLVLQNHTYSPTATHPYAKLTADMPYKLRMEHLDGKTYVYVNDILLIEDNNNPVTGIKAGIWVYQNSVLLDNVSIWKLDDPETHSHELAAVEAKAASCTEDGNVAHWICNDKTCGILFSDAEGQRETTLEEVTLTKLGHDFSGSNYSYSDTIHWHICSRSGCTATDTPAAHTGGTATCTTKAVCEVCGQEYGVAAHSYSTTYLKENADASKHYHVCTACGSKDTGEAHTWNVEAATEETDKHCTVCGYVAEEKLNHTHKLTLVEGKAPTCTENGSKAYYTCTCGKFFEDAACTVEITDLNTWKVIEKLGHSFTDYVSDNNATCTADGTETAKCDRCDETDTRTDVGSKLDHEDKNGDGKCDGCDEVLDDGKPEEKPEKPGWIIPSCPGKPSKPGHVDLPFNDVAKSDWFYDEVSYVYENGLMNGPRPGEFEPETAITRGMIVTILYRLEGEPMNNFVGLFSDVPNYEWYTDAVEWAAKNDIVTGYTNGNFGPMDPVTREQLAAILYRYADFRGYDVDGSTSLKSFNDDETISTYAIAPMEWAVKNGLINGSHNNLAPKANATRAQAAAILMRFCEEVAE